MNVLDAILGWSNTTPDQLAVADGQTVLTFADLAAAIATQQGLLRDGGVGPGDRVGVCLTDGCPALVASLATLAAGGVHVPIDHQLTPREQAELIGQSGVNWRLDASGLQPTGQPRPEDPLGRGASAFLRFTSGTTGDAKGVLLSHASLLARATAAGGNLGLEPGQRMLWLLPLAYHWAASVIAALVAGTGVVFGNRLRLADTLGIARQHGTTLAYASPWHGQRFAAQAAGALAPLHTLICTTAALDQQVAEELRRTHGLSVRQALGIIECGLPLVGPGTAAGGPGNVGKPLAGHVCRILNPDADGSGELAIAGPGLFDAYLHPWRPASTVLVDGFFATGDRASIVADGQVRLLGRLKDVINVGGVKVFPQDIETVLLAHPQVARCRAWPSPDSRLGEVVAVTITPTSEVVDTDLLTGALQVWCQERLAHLKQPVIWNFGELPVTGSGKVRRR